MTALAEIRFVALKPLRLSTGTGRLRLAPGDEIPRELHGRWLDNCEEAEKVAKYIAGSVTDATDAELIAEVKRRGLTMTVSRAKKAA